MKNFLPKGKIKLPMFVIASLTALVMLESPAYGQTYDFAAMIERIAQDRQQSGGKYVSTMDNWVVAQNSDGSWNDCSYGNLSSSVSTWDNHLMRLWYLAAAASNPNHSEYNNDAYKNAIRKGLDFWFYSNTVDPNWWFNKIYFPQKLGEILIFLREFSGFIPKVSATETDEDELLSLFEPTSINDISSRGTGANAVDIARHYIYRGLLTQDGSLLENTRNHVELILTENIGGDLVYQDHGPQIQIASYGWVFCDRLILLAYYLSDSPAKFDVDSQNFNTVIRFIRETQISSIRGNSWDFSVMGRAISRPNNLNANLNYLQYVIDDIDPEHASTYTDALDRIKGNKPASYNVREFNKHYWASDYTQHAREDFLFAVRNVSTRTVEAETGNGENLKANYFSHGATFMSVDGNEYTNIMPIWDWAMIPGTTIPHTTNFPYRTNWGANYGNTSFVGGVSNDTHGSAVLDLDKAGLTGKKSWFFFEKEVVCLGSGITGNSGKNVRTTLNQCWMEKPSYFKETGDAQETMKSVSSSNYSNSNLKYLRNGKFGYYFPNQGNVKFSMKSQTGSWYEINNNRSNELQSGYVFKIWFDHGSIQYNEKYSYIIVPGIDSEQKAANYDMNEIEIVENTKAVQAVYHETLDLLQVIFHEATDLQHQDKTITVNKPCALMFENGTLVTLSDPGQSNSIVDVTIDVNNDEYSRFVSLPTSSELLGSSVSVDFGIDYPTSIQGEPQKLKIACSPNPTTGIVNIVSEKEGLMSLNIRNMNGQVIVRDQFRGKTTVDLSGQSSGVYLIEISNENQTYQQKLLKY